MKTIIAVILFFALSFFSGFAFASPFQSPASFNSMGGCCPTVTSQQVFTNPHTGWSNMLVETPPCGCGLRP